MTSGVEIIDKDLDLLYSPDDDGWYFQLVDSFSTSVVYESREAAMRAYEEDEIEWR